MATRGRPTVHGDRISTAVRLPVDLHDRLHAAADERVVSVNLIVTKAIEHYLDRLPPLDLNGTRATGEGDPRG